jgi:hypothetical protein
MEIADGEYVGALVWAHWVPGADKVIEVHAAAAAEYRGRWLTSRTLDSLFQIVGIAGAKTIIAQITSPLAERIWRGLGFEIAAGLAYLNVESWHGKSREVGGRPSGRPAGGPGGSEAPEDPGGTEDTA